MSIVIENIDTLNLPKGKIIVFTNGCFDLLHEGHLYLLKESKKYGDILIVAINTDESIKRIKGKSRPIDTIGVRIEKISKTGIVDYIIPFSDDTPINLIHKIVPNFIIKGGDYKPHNVVGGNFIYKSGGKVIIIPLITGISTTEIIKNLDN